MSRFACRACGQLQPVGVQWEPLLVCIACQSVQVVELHLRSLFELDLVVIERPGLLFENTVRNAAGEPVWGDIKMPEIAWLLAVTVVDDEAAYFWRPFGDGRLNGREGFWRIAAHQGYLRTLRLYCEKPDYEQPQTMPHR